MSGDALWFAAIPNAALIVFFGTVLYRLVVRPVTLPDTIERDRSRGAGFGRIPLQWGLALVLAGHILAVLFSGALEAWTGAPLRLYLLEATGLALGLWAVSGFLVLSLRWLRAGVHRTRLGVIDVIVVGALIIVLITGVLTAVLYRFGSAWSVSIVVPWFWSILGANPRTELMGDLPLVAQVHAVAGFVLVAAFPLSRWVTILALPVSYVRRWWAELIRRSPNSVRGATTWAGGYGRGASIAFFIVVITVWLPSRVLSELGSQSRLIQDVLGAGVWAAGLAIVLFGLRWAQKTGRI